MDVQRASPRIMFHELRLDLTYPQHGGFEDLLHVETFLGVVHLIIAVFKFGVDVDILDV